MAELRSDVRSHAVRRSVRAVCRRVRAGSGPNLGAAGTDGSSGAAADLSLDDDRGAGGAQDPGETGAGPGGEAGSKTTEDTSSERSPPQLPVPPRTSRSPRRTRAVNHWTKRSSWATWNKRLSRVSRTHRIGWQTWAERLEGRCGSAWSQGTHRGTRSQRREGWVWRLLPQEAANCTALCWTVGHTG